MPARFLSLSPSLLLRSSEYLPYLSGSHLEVCVGPLVLQLRLAETRRHYVLVRRAAAHVLSMGVLTTSSRPNKRLGSLTTKTLPRGTGSDEGGHAWGRLICFTMCQFDDILGVLCYLYFC